MIDNGRSQGTTGTTGTPGSAAVPAALIGDCALWGEDSQTHEAWSHGLDRGDFLDHGEGRHGHLGPVVDCLDAGDCMASIINIRPVTAWRRACGALRLVGYVCALCAPSRGVMGVGGGGGKTPVVAERTRRLKQSLTIGS